MKVLIILCVLGISAVFFTSGQKDITGTWVADKLTNSDAAVLRIQMGEGYYSAKLDLPGQQVYDRIVSLQMKNDRLQVILDKERNCFIDAVITDSTLEGLSFVDGSSTPVKFRRLNKK